MLQRRSILVLVAVLVVAATMPCRAGGGASTVELFTSQGCSSCPPADKLLASYASRPDVVALTYNVDYWDYLGWKDTLANPVFSRRQREYARTRGDGEVYTPQVVVNGLAHAVGSKAKRIDAAIAATAPKIAGRRPELAVVRDKAMVEIRIGAAPGAPASPATVWLATVSPRITVPVKHGENRGTSLTYHNVVRSLQAVGNWSGAATRLSVQQSAVLIRNGDRCVVLVQEGTTGPVLAAAWMP